VFLSYIRGLSIDDCNLTDEGWVGVLQTLCFEYDKQVAGEHDQVAVWEPDWNAHECGVNYLFTLMIQVNQKLIWIQIISFPRIRHC